MSDPYASAKVLELLREGNDEMLGSYVEAFEFTGRLANEETRRKIGILLGTIRMPAVKNGASKEKPTEARVRIRQELIDIFKTRSVDGH